jgi:beta-phosphoglucomutase-like phosphatase (HAD superfamily)
VYQHVLAWREALGEEGIDISVWRIHRKIGMSGGLFTNMLLRETGFAIDPERIERLRRHHAAAFARHLCHVQPLPGARELLSYLTHAEIPWAIATSGRMETARFLLDRLEIDCNRIPVVTRDEVKHAKPDPDLFRAAAARLRLKIGTATVIGDSVWDMPREERPPWGLACYRVAIARTSLSVPARIVSMRTRPISSDISTKSAVASN